MTNKYCVTDSGLLIPEQPKKREISYAIPEFQRETRFKVDQLCFHLYGVVANSWRFSDREDNEARLQLIKDLAEKLLGEKWEYDGEILC